MGYSFTFNFSEEDIDFSPRLGYFYNYDNFLINEFFNSTDSEIDAIMNGYYLKYGESAYNYVMKTYFYNWRQGSRHLTNIQQKRILALMPKFLNEEAKKKLELIQEKANFSLGTKEIVDSISKTVEAFFQRQLYIYRQRKIVSINDLIDILNSEIERTTKLNIQSYYWQREILILNEDEKKESLQISQYIILEKLQKQFNSIENDFNTFFPFLKLIERGVFVIEYELEKLNLKIDLGQLDFTTITFPKTSITEIESKNRYKVYSDKYLANELIIIHNEVKENVSNSFLNSNDLALFFRQYQELQKSSNDITMKSTFTGEAGILKISVEMKSLNMLRTYIVKSYAKILISALILGGLIKLILFLELDHTIVLIIGGLSVISCFNYIKEEAENISNNIKDIKKYGHK